MRKRRSVIIATQSDSDWMALCEHFCDAEKWRPIRATTGRETRALLKEQGNGLGMLLIDSRLLDMDGLAAIRQVQTPPTVDCPPVVLLREHGAPLPDGFPEDLFLSETLEVPIEPRVAARRLQVILELHSYQLRDVSYTHQLARDALIGLPIGRALADAAADALAESRGEGILALINVDALRAINERSGYAFGDRVLLDIAGRAMEGLPGDAVIGRPSGDMLLIFLPGRTDRVNAIRFLEKLREGLHIEYPEAPGGSQRVTACIGASIAPEDGDSFDTLYERAETAMGAAKQIGRDVLMLYSAALESRNVALSGTGVFTEQEVVPAVNTFISVIDVKDGALMGYDYVSLPPMEDSRAAQRAIHRISGLKPSALVHYLRVDIRRCFYSIEKLDREGASLPSVSFCTMLRGDQAETLLQVLQQALSDHAVDPSRICIMIAQEMALTMRRSRLIALGRDIRAMGFSFGMHNVGERCLSVTCFFQNLFDRLLFEPTFTDDILDGIYPAAFIQKCLGHILEMGTSICFPARMSRASQATLAQLLPSSFGAYDRILFTGEEVKEDLARHSRQSAPGILQMPPVLFDISNDRFNEIFTRIGVILFDWRPHEDVTAFSESFSVLYGQPSAYAGLRGLIKQVLHPEDFPRMMDLLMQAKHGRPIAESAFRMRRNLADERESFAWRRFFVVSSAGSDGSVSHVFCLNFDIDREQREMQSFMQRAEMDTLTGLLNRGAIEGRVQAYLQGEGQGGRHAMMIVDVDDFKHVNDRLGHLEGDTVLKYIAAQMRRLFRSGDVISRSGGDEFMVFLKDIGDIDRIAGRAEDLCEAVRGGNALHPSWGLSCTIGVARYPDDARNFQELYAKADLALYRAKAAGKDTYALYEETDAWQISNG